MLDYYGSIPKKEDEIIKDLISYYTMRNYDENIVKNIINDLMENGEIKKEYSVSGWMVFFQKESIEKINNELKKKEIADILYNICGNLDVCNKICKNI